MATLHTALTEEIPAAILSDLRFMLEAAFSGEFADSDWEHCLGGVHVWVAESNRIISHASVVDRVLICCGQTLRVGYVEAVATAATHRRQGHGALVMGRIGQLIRERYRLGALSTGVHTFFETFGWERWCGRTFSGGQDARVRTPADDDSVMILRTPRSPDLDLEGDMTCDQRSGDLW